MVRHLASSYTRRTLTAGTAGALGFLGAVLGAVGGYISLIGWLRGNSLNGGVAALANVPIGDLLLILFGMSVFAAIVGWVLAAASPQLWRIRRSSERTGAKDHLQLHPW
jgi:hypothetical protein